MPVMLTSDGKVLLTASGAVAMDPDCCCEQFGPDCSEFCAAGTFPLRIKCVVVDGGDSRDVPSGTYYLLPQNVSCGGETPICGWFIPDAGTNTFGNHITCFQVVFIGGIGIAGEMLFSILGAGGFNIARYDIPLSGIDCTKLTTQTVPMNGGPGTITFTFLYS